MLFISTIRNIRCRFLLDEKKVHTAHKARENHVRILFNCNPHKIIPKTYAGKQYPSRSDFDFDDRSLAALWNVVVGDDICSRKGAKPTRDIFDRAITRSKKGVVGGGSGGDVDVYSSALAAAEDLALRSIGKATQEGPSSEVTDVFALAGDIAYYAEGVDVFRGHIWRWHDGGGDAIERIYSAAETEAAAAATQQQRQQKQRRVIVVANDSEECTIPRASKMSNLIRTCREGMIGRVLRPRGLDDEDCEPFTIFGLRCATPLCGGGAVP